MRRLFTSFCFVRFLKSLFVPVLSVPRQGSRHSFRPSPRQVGVRVRRDCRESAGREPSSPPIAGEVRRCPRLLPARRSREISAAVRLLAASPPARRSWEKFAAVRGSFQPADRGRYPPPSVRWPRALQPADRGRSPPLSAAPNPAAHTEPAVRGR